jgi:lipoprotein-releasing system ATP-binding protein
MSAPEPAVVEPAAAQVGPRLPAGASPARLRAIEVARSFHLGGEAVPVLRGVSFALDAGEALAVTGPSGSGKSTLLHVLGTLDAPDSGRVEIDGRDPAGLAEPELARFRNRAIGFVFQEHYLLPQYTVIENVLLPALAFPGDRAAARARARELVERVGLGHRLRHRPAELSGGERQRVAVARALVNRPGLLLCDEPTGSLDRESAAAVVAMLFELHRAERAALVVVTHDEGLAGRFGRRGRLVEGRLAEGAASS